MDILLQDLRYAVRALARSKAFTAVVVAVLALGIGVNTMVFCMAWGVMWRPWPFPQNDRIVHVGEANRHLGLNDMFVSWQTFREIQSRAKSFSTLGAYWQTYAIVTIDRDPERFYGTSNTSGLFPALGVMPELGRNFTPDEETWGRNFDQVIISDRLWRQRFHADTHALGRTIRVNGRVRAIVGVMPPGFRFPEIADLWIPAGFDVKTDFETDHGLNLVGRLAPGATVAGANAEVAAIVAGIAHREPALKDFSGHVHLRQDWESRGARPLMIVILAAVMCVLLVACGNVANLMLARAASRRREISLRLALGASRGRVVRQLLTESVLIASVGGLLGLVIAHYGTIAWISSIPLELPYTMRFSFDGAVFTYAAVVTLVAGVLFGLAPALHASDERLAEALREGSAQSGVSRSGRRLRNALVVAELAFSLMLLVGAGLMVRTFEQFVRDGRSLRTDNVATGEVLLPIANFPADTDRRSFYRDLVRRLEATPGVTEVSGMVNLPLSRNSNGGLAVTPAMSDPAHDGVDMTYGCTLPGAFRMLGISIVRGREFTARDDERAPRVAIVDEMCARRLWPHADPIGQRLKMMGSPDSLGWATVVGVVRHVTMNVEEDEERGGVWFPEYHEPAQILSMLVRSNAGPGAAAQALRSALRAMNPDIPAIDLRSLAAEFDWNLWLRRLFASMMASFGVLALVIAGVGLYGVMAYSVAQRTQEIGVRMALGAEAVTVQRMVVGQALRLTLIGIGLGLVGAFVLTRFMATAIQGVSPTDPPTFTVVAVLLALSGLIAAWVPALRATRVDPMVALRCE